MRIISGKYKGVRIKSPKGIKTRPTSDRVKESIFSVINKKITGSTVLDLFSGTGSIGIEFLSRGAESVYLNDNNRMSYYTIKDNVNKLNCSAKVYNLDYINMLNKIKNKNILFDIIYLDPPYTSNFAKESIKAILDHNILRENGLIVYEHSTKKEQLVIDKRLYIYDQRTYGETTISLIKYINTHV